MYRRSSRNRSSNIRLHRRSNRRDRRNIRLHGLYNRGDRRSSGLHGRWYNRGGRNSFRPYRRRIGNRRSDIRLHGRNAGLYGLRTFNRTSHRCRYNWLFSNDNTLINNRLFRNDNALSRDRRRNGNIANNRHTIRLYRRSSRNRWCNIRLHGLHNRGNRSG